MAEIIFSDSALDDLNQIMEYIAADSPHYAYQFSQNIFERVEQLNVFPHSGRVVPEFNDKDIRELIYQNYRIVYLTHLSDKIYIARIIHGARELNELS